MGLIDELMGKGVDEKVKFLGAQMLKFVELQEDAVLGLGKIEKLLTRIDQNLEYLKKTGDIIGAVVDPETYGLKPVEEPAPAPPVEPELQPPATEPEKEPEPEKEEPPEPPQPSEQDIEEERIRAQMIADKEKDEKQDE